MLKVAVLALGLLSLAVTVKAADGDPPQRKRPVLTEEQKKERKEIVDKYDKNKDGKLDAEERKAMSAEDKEKLAKISGRPARGEPKKKEEDK